MSRLACPSFSSRPILVTVDFEPASRDALVFAARLAMCSRTELKILHVAHTPADKPGYYQRHGKRDTILPQEDLASRMLSEFLSDVYRDNPGLDILKTAETRVVSGLPVTRIPEVARAMAAGLIVMGHVRPRGLSRFFLASLTQRVARKCSIPITVVYADGKHREPGLQSEPDYLEDEEQADVKVAPVV